MAGDVNTSTSPHDTTGTDGAMGTAADCTALTFAHPPTCTTPSCTGVAPAGDMHVTCVAFTYTHPLHGTPFSHASTPSVSPVAGRLDAVSSPAVHRGCGM